MQELEKILEEINAEFDKRTRTLLKIMAGLSNDVYRYVYGKSLEAYQQGKLFVEDIIRKHMNDGWISVEDGLPEDGKSVLCCSDDERMMIGVLHKEYYVDFGIAVAENYNQIMNDVIAWQPLPEPYRPEGSDGECGAGDENNGGCAWRLKMQNRETRCRN